MMKQQVALLKKECEGTGGWAVIPVTGGCALANAADVAGWGLAAPVTVVGQSHARVTVVTEIDSQQGLNRHN
jgi:hypothetical protein